MTPRVNKPKAFTERFPVMSKKNGRVTKTSPTPCPGELTVDERDAINAAKQRAKDMLTLVIATLNEDDVLVTLSGNDDADRTGAVLTACDIMRESLNAIDEAFHAADQRQETATAAAGGVR
jgi:hypothetical protein